MYIKFLLVCLFLTNMLNAQYQKVKIGYIDSEYKERLTKDQLYNIIKEIENNFESTIGVNVFDYHKSGKPIDIVFIPPSKKKLDINHNIKLLKRKKNKIEQLQKYILNKKSYIHTSHKKIEQLNNELNKDIDSLNDYIYEVNGKNVTSETQYNKIKKYIKSKEKKINYKKDRFNQKRTKFNNFLSAYNQKISTYNTLINQYNRIQRKVEIMSRSLKEVKGVAKGYTKTTFKTYSKDGETYTEKSSENYMEKIEIYGFNDHAELKAVLAHEIGHLVGMGHIDFDGALMNPMLQKNQIKNLQLTTYDMDEFVNSF